MLASQDSAPSLHTVVKSARGLAPPLALDKMGFEPMQSDGERVKSVSRCFVHRVNVLIIHMSKG